MRIQARTPTVSVSLEDLARRARQGDGEALDTLLGRIRGKIYALAMRMLWSPDDGQDATQEILLRIATRLSSFRGESAFTTWMYRLAVNYLRSVRRGKLEERFILESVSWNLSEHCAESFQADDPTHMSLLLEEIKAGCALGVISCLDCPHRLAYLLGEILDLDCEQAALILDVSAATFRKRLSRARADMIDFMQQHYGPGGALDSRLHRRRLRRAICAQNSQCAARFQRVLENVRLTDETQRVIDLFACRQSTVGMTGPMPHRCSRKSQRRSSTRSEWRASP